jgi:hypothetical protein
MSTKSRQVIFGSRIRGAKIRAEGAREEAVKAVRAADRAEAEAWSIRMEGYGGPVGMAWTARDLRSLNLPIQRQCIVGPPNGLTCSR